MAYPFVKAKWFTPRAIVEVRAFLWHMAEGGGTVGYLTNPGRRVNGVFVPVNVSAHFVIEYSGRIVQMVLLSDASHSAHVDVDPDDVDASDCGGLYSDAVGRAVIGTGWSDINRYAISVEIEGFRRDGPNAAQQLAIARLYRDLRSQFPSARGNLGHRDVQDYKSCPGCKFPWSDIDGHGLFTKAPTPTTRESDVAIATPADGQTKPWTGFEIALSQGRNFYNDAGLTSLRGEMSVTATVPYGGLPDDSGSRFVCVRTRQRKPLAPLDVPEWTWVYVVEDAGTPVRVAMPCPPPPPPDIAGEIAEAVDAALTAYKAELVAHIQET